MRSFDYPEVAASNMSPQNRCLFCYVKEARRYIAEILEQLLNNRKLVKKQRKKFHEKSMDYAVLDGRQLALKVCANSVYGFTGAGQGYLGEKRIALCHKSRQRYGQSYEIHVRRPLQRAWPANRIRRY